MTTPAHYPSGTRGRPEDGAEVAVVCAVVDVALRKGEGSPLRLRLGRAVQHRVASTPSSASCTLNPACSNRLATSRGTFRPLVSWFGLPV